MSHLRTAAQFLPLDVLRDRVAALGPARGTQAHQAARRRCARCLLEAFAGEPALARAVDLVWDFSARDPGGTVRGLFAEMQQPGGGRRGHRLEAETPSHQPLPPDAVPAAVERLADWAAEPSFAELHPVEQAALMAARAAEIAPFARLNLQLGTVTSWFWTLRAGFPLPWWDPLPPGKLAECLDAAFRVEMQPLVDHFARGLRAALQGALDSA